MIPEFPAITGYFSFCCKGQWNRLPAIFVHKPNQDRIGALPLDERSRLWLGGAGDLRTLVPRVATDATGHWQHAVFSEGFLLRRS